MIQTLFLLLWLTPAPVDQAAAAACCFNHAGFAGGCRVELAEGETCGAVLAYLNNPRSVGKTYCGSTQLRGGWQQVACEGEAPRVAAACEALAS
jgi:hypothetical protein